MYLRMSLFNIVIVASFAHVFEIRISKKSVNSILCNFVDYQLLRELLVRGISKRLIYCTRNFEMCRYAFFELTKAIIFLAINLLSSLILFSLLYFSIIRKKTIDCKFVAKLLFVESLNILKV